MEIDYNTLTREQLEEYVEFIDWSLVSSNLLTEEVKVKFTSIPQLQARIWIEELLLKMVMKKDKDDQDDIFFYLKEIKYIHINFSMDYLWCKADEIWYVLKTKLNCDYIVASAFISNVLEQYIKNKETQE